MKTAKRLFHQHRYELILGAMIFLYILFFSWLSVNRLLSFNDHYYDLGIMNQTVYNTSQGRFLQMTNQDFLKNTLRFANHFDPLLIIFSPLYRLFPSPIWLLIGQTVAIALGALAVYLISKKITKKKTISLVFAFLYLNYYPLQRVNLFEFHAVALAIPLLLFSYYYLVIKRAPKKIRKKVSLVKWLLNYENYIVGLLFIFLALLAKENVSLTVAFLAIYMFLIHREKRRLAAIIFFLSGGIFLLAFLVIIPQARGGLPHFASRYYTLDFLTNINRFFRSETIVYLKNILVPVGFLSFFSPLNLLIALPEFLKNSLSSFSGMRDLHFQYSSVMTPFIFISAIFGYRFLRERWGYRLMRKVLLVIVVVSIGLSYQKGPMAFWKLGYKVDKRKLARVYLWQRNLGDEKISVATTPRLAPFFTNRINYYDVLFDSAYKTNGLGDEVIARTANNYRQADYVVIAKAEIGHEGLPQYVFYHHLTNDWQYRKIYGDRYLEVYKKIK